MSLTTAPIRSGLNIGMALLLFTLFVSLWMIADALHDSTRFNHLYSVLLLINVTALIALSILIALNLKHLFYQVQKKRAGAWLTFRLVSLLIILSTLPVIVLYYFSLEFLHQRLDHWFDSNIEHVLTDAFELSQTVLNSSMRDALKETNVIADEISIMTDDETIMRALKKLHAHSGATELSLLTHDGQLLTSHSVSSLSILPDEKILLQLIESDKYVSLEPIDDSGLRIRIIVRLNQERLLQGLFPIPPRIRELIENIELSYTKYKERIYLQKPLQMTFTLVLSLVLLFSLFSAIWMAFFIARRFVAPLSHFVEGTRAVAQGDYKKKLSVKYLDELGFLVDSFNEMTHKIAQARDDVKLSQQVTQTQRAYLAAVLERLSSGVLSIDSDQRLRTANPAMAHILGLLLNELLGKTLTQLETEHSKLRPFCSSIRQYLDNNAQDWREEVSLFGKNGQHKLLICCGTQLQPSKATEGYVIVCDDVTTLIQAQRDAAWSEVARRLAHEIKNPLTPIQLSAERLRQKYLPHLSEKEGSTLDRMTHTIIQQVDAMKTMVNAFSEYARTPDIHKETLNLNQLIKEVLDLYPQILTTFDKHIPNIKADKGQIRQVLHNLIKNAREAKFKDTEITVNTAYLSSLQQIEIRIANQGIGISEDLLKKIFEPYVTTKKKGTGLGLAIVKKIITEHGGTVWIEQNTETTLVIHLPVFQELKEL